MRSLFALSLLFAALASTAQATQMNALIIRASAVYVTTTTGVVSATNVYAKNISATTLSGNRDLITGISISDTIGGIAYVAVDTNIVSTSPNNNNGGGTAMTLSTVAFPLVAFDLSQIPSSLKVHAAYLNLYTSSLSVNGSFGVYPITSSWTENTVTWNTSPTIGAMINTGTLAPVGARASVDISSTAQSWINGSLPNNGLMIKGISAQGGFRSKENTATFGMIPTLTIW